MANGFLRRMWRLGISVMFVPALPGVTLAQSDVIPSSVDIRMVQGAADDQLLLQLKTHSSANFGGILSALTVTIRYDAASAQSLGLATSFCNAWSPFSPSPVVVNGGVAYRTYNGFGVNRLEDPIASGGCNTSLVPETWFTVATIPVIGTGCTIFTLGNDAYTEEQNRSYYISMGGWEVTGNVLGGPVAMGACGMDCLGVPGGPALPGTPCDDNDPATTNDTWTAECVCVGTPACLPPVINTINNNSPVCSNGTLSLGVSASGTSPLTYGWSGPGTFSPSPSAPSVSVTGAVSGNYQVTVTNACGSVTGNAAVTVTPAPSATISYAGSPYCAGGGTATVTRTGTAGGTYSASLAGLSLNSATGAINLGASAAGTYTVTYSIAASGGCSAFSTTAAVTISTSPSATISYTGSPYCAGSGTATVTRTGTAGGTYSASPAGLSLNSTTGAINLGASTAGTYTVTYSIAASGGCSAFSTTAAVTISASPSATISYTGSPYCVGGGTATVTRTGTAGGTYSASPAGLVVNPNNGNINLGTSTAGTYTVTYSIAASGGCSAFSTTAAVTISTSPSATISYDGSPYCVAGGTATVTRTGTAGGTYGASPAGLSLNSTTGAINLGTSAAGTYTVTYSIAASGGCSAFSTTAAVTIDPGPFAIISYGDAFFCTNGDLLPAMLTGTPGGTFSATPAGLSVNALTGAINLGASNAGPYTVQYSIAASAQCPAYTATTNLVVFGVGDPCDDGNPATVNDVITEDCSCQGQLPDGLPDLVDGTGIRLYPNPVMAGRVHFNVTGLPGMDGPVDLGVRDLSGRLLHGRHAIVQEGLLEVEIGMRMAQGVYIVEVVGHGRRFIGRLVVE